MAAGIAVGVVDCVDAAWATIRRAPMVGTAAHLVDAVIPLVPFRQRVLALPKRLRPALRADPALATCVLRIFLGVIERALRVACRDAPAGSRLGALSFVQRFGSALNEHWHYRCRVSDGLSAEAGVGLKFLPVTADGAMAGRVQAEVRPRVVLARRLSLPARSMSLVPLR
ncbi:hypothetical protein [Luteimonas sp. R10]|uniref:hypothetical protein n=1 Tax=Luteimonas sp. R10 TaxID=3108176 RepID=UPI0030864E07|nr:hypothetical protein U3649_09780 [Luteimonas sp. R10]